VTRRTPPPLRSLRLAALVLLPMWLAILPFILIASAEGWPWPDPSLSLAAQVFAVAAIYGAPLVVILALLSFALPAARTEGAR